MAAKKATVSRVRKTLSVSPPPGATVSTSAISATMPNLRASFIASAG
jgi:hypothetical protein